MRPSQPRPPSRSAHPIGSRPRKSARAGRYSVTTLDITAAASRPACSSYSVGRPRCRTGRRRVASRRISRSRWTAATRPGRRLRRRKAGSLAAVEHARSRSAAWGGEDFTEAFAHGLPALGGCDLGAGRRPRRPHGLVLGRGICEHDVHVGKRGSSAFSSGRHEGLSVARERKLRLLRSACSPR